MKSLFIGLLTLAALSTAPAFAEHRKAFKQAHIDTRSERAHRQLLADLRLRGSNIPAILSANGKGGR